MKRVWLSLIAFSLAVALAGFLSMSCDSGSSDGEDEEKDCATVCGEAQCGEIDGCTCGTSCGDNEECVDNMCKAVVTEECQATCGEAVCGEVEGCVCGECLETEKCEAGVCVDATAEPDCETVCTDKCGTIETCECGECGEGQECNATTNVCEDVGPEPKCVGDDEVPYECGDDGAGGTCGACKYGDCIDHFCVCEPDCADKACGPDGCGEVCGECGADQACVAGECADTCDPYEVYAEYAWSDTVQKVNYMAIGKGGHPGEAIDVDDDPDTCAPEADCEDGLNNQLSGLMEQISALVDPDAEIAKALDEGQIILAAELVDMATDGTEFVMNMYISDPVADKETCDFQADKCEYVVKTDSFDQVSCEPIIAFDNVVINDGKLVAGGPDSLFSVAIPIEEIVFMVTANMAQITGDVTGEGDAMKIENGLIGGAVRKDKLMEAVDLIPEDAGLPVSKDMIKNLLDMFVEPDIDTDDDGDPDAASIGVKFGTIVGTIVGLETVEE